MEKAKINKKVALIIGGREVTDYIFDYGEISNNIALMTKGTELHVYDADTGEFKFKLDNIEKARYSNDSLIVKSVYGAMGVYDYDGRNLVPVSYADIYNKGEYYVATKSDSICVLYKRDIKNGKADIVISEEKGFTKLRPCNEGVITCNSQEKYGVYSYEGKELIEAKYDLIQPFGYSYVVSTNNSGKIRYGVFTSKGKKVYGDVYTGYELDLPLIYLTKKDKRCAYNLDTCKKLVELKPQRFVRYANVISVTYDNSSYYIRSAENGKLLLEHPIENVSVYGDRVLYLKDSARTNYFYLPVLKKLIDADSYDVKYEGGKYYIRYIIKYNDRIVNIPWSLVEKDKLY